MIYNLHSDVFCTDLSGQTSTLLDEQKVKDETVEVQKRPK